ncbi:MAG: GNAT family N-acetyltransferase [Elusimicrobiota bacterium]
MTRTIDTIRTPRLSARRIVPEDFDFILRMNQDARVMAFIGGPRSAEKTREYMSECLAQWDERGYGVYAVSDAASGDAIGRAGLRWRKVDGAWETDLGYSFLPSAWGKGYSTEIGAALLEAAFATLGLESVIAFTMTTNAASRRVMEKLGFRREKEFAFAGEPHVLYRILAERR